MTLAKPTKTVYCYYYPEVRSVIDDIVAEYPHDVFLQSITPGLDSFHEPVIEAYLHHFREQLPGLESYPERYVTNGASESIFHILSHIVAFQRETPLYVLHGDYEGYAGYGMNLGLNFTTVAIDADFGLLPPGIFFISNPSARDGNILPNEKIVEIGEAGHEIVLDVTYAGATDPHTFLVDHPAIRAVLVSLSKPFGLYYYRIGFCFMRQENKTLWVNRWFKGILPLIIAKEVLTRFSASELCQKYRPAQQQVMQELSAEYGFPLLPSDVFLLARALPEVVPASKQDEMAMYARGGGYRFCLTPCFLDLEQRT